MKLVISTEKSDSVETIFVTLSESDPTLFIIIGNCELDPIAIGSNISDDGEAKISAPFIPKDTSSISQLSNGVTVLGVA